MITLGVIADTHIPDRMKKLPPQVREVFRGVTAILHAGDVSTASVLDELGTMAPVHAVAGNSDFVRLNLPRDRVLEFGGVRIGLTHGHGGWGRYLLEKIVYHTVGFRLTRFTALARSSFAGAHVLAVVFGHIHRPVNRWEEGVLMFNPGSLAPDYFPPHGPAVGLLRLDGGRVTGEIVQI